MKKHKLLSMLLAITLLFVSGCQKTTSSSGNIQTQDAFDEFLENEFIASMESDYISSHIYLENPESYEVDTSKIEVSLGSGYSIKDREQARMEIKELLDDLSQFNSSELREDQQYLYTTLTAQLTIENELLSETYDYYDQAFSSLGGLHYQLPTLFSDWILREEQDIVDLITLVQDVKPYVEEALSYTKEQANKGLLMTNIEDVVSYCETIVENKEDSAILSSIYESIDTLALDEEIANTYKEQLKNAFDTYFYPAYDEIISVMNSVSSQNNEEGLAAFPNGKEYYELLIQKDVGALTSIDDIEDMLEDAFSGHLFTMYALLSNEEVMNVMETNEFPETTYTSYTEILEDIQTKMKEDFPSVNDISYDIYDVNEQLASTSGVAAYFNVPALDATTPKQMRVNPNSSDIESLDTYMTVAHEGFPGHMYQYAFMYENISSNFHKTLIDVPAYVEGYAVYSQYQSLAYIDGIDQDVLSLYKENEIISYCAILLSDIGIHYYGWSFDEYKEYMSEMGFEVSDEDSLKAQYNQLQANPAAFVPYYIGYLEFEQIREEAEEALGDKFNEQEFHNAILSTGIANFEVVADYVKQNYIDVNK